MDNGFNDNRFENSEANTGFSADSQEKTTNSTNYQYKYDPYTGERKVYYGYAGGPAGGSQPPKKPKRSKKGLWIALDMHRHHGRDILWLDNGIYRYLQ